MQHFTVGYTAHQLQYMNQYMNKEKHVYLLLRDFLGGGLLLDDLSGDLLRGDRRGDRYRCRDLDRVRRLGEYRLGDLRRFLDRDLLQNEANV